MEVSTSKEREVKKQPLAPEPYQHPPAILSHVYMITRSITSVGDWEGTMHYAVKDYHHSTVRLYSLDDGIMWASESTFGDSDNEWVDITSKVYLNTDGLEG